LSYSRCIKNDIGWVTNLIPKRNNLFIKSVRKGTVSNCSTRTREKWTKYHVYYLVSYNLH
jgi:hypothetical protein